MPVRYGVPQGGDGQLPVAGAAGCLADHAAAEQVDKGTQQPAFVCRHVGEIRYPRLIRQGDPEILPEEVGKGGSLWIGYRRLYVPAPGYRHQPRRVHQPANALPADPVAALVQFLLDFLCAVDAIALVEDLLDLRREQTIHNFPGTALALLVLVVPLPPRFQQFACPTDTDLARCLFDGCKLYRGFFAMYAEIFWKVVLILQLPNPTSELLKLPLLRAGLVKHRLPVECALRIDCVLSLSFPQRVLVNSELVRHAQHAAPTFRYQLHRRDLLLAAVLVPASHSLRPSVSVLLYHTFRLSAISGPGHTACSS